VTKAPRTKGAAATGDVFLGPAALIPRGVTIEIAAPTARLVVASADPRIAARIRYAFSAYAALYGIRVVQAGAADVTVAYGQTTEPGCVAEPAHVPDVVLPAGYRPRAASTPAPAPTWIDGLPCFHPAPRGEPDPLAETFEWLAAPHEAACTELDDVGRIPVRHTLAGTHGLDPRIPWVNRFLARLHVAVRAALPRLPAAPPSPFPAGRTFVASHDVDHLSDRKLVNARRIAENIGIALLRRHDPATAAQIAGAAVRRAAGRRPVASGLAEVLAGEAARGVRATYPIVAESLHPRDPGYRLDEDHVRRTLASIAEAGHELGVHGSYRSLERPGQLAREYTLLADAGFPVSGGRQHWLRHRGRELFDALVAAGAQWDSTRGHPDDIGFRHGAAFPFLPYDLTAEQAIPIVEIPLVVMERALCAATPDPSAWATTAVDVLRAAGDDGWGGVAVLWHDAAFTATFLPARLSDAYWAVLDAGDSWTTGGEVAAAARARWEAAGALDEVTEAMGS
jgi:hypothetical protein